MYNYRKYVEACPEQQMCYYNDGLILFNSVISTAKVIASNQDDREWLVVKNHGIHIICMKVLLCH
jgi:hypothetical protein